MKIEQLLNEHKKGVKAVKYAKKPVPVVGPEAQKKKAKVKTAPPKTELEKHSKLATKIEGVSEGSAQDKLHKRHQELRKKSGLPDPDYYKELKSTFDLPDDERHAKTAELKKKYKVKDMKEAKQPEAPKPRNFVAKNAKTAGAGVHKDAKKAAKEVRGQKHKNKEIAEGESDYSIPGNWSAHSDFKDTESLGSVYNTKGKYLGKWDGKRLMPDAGRDSVWHKWRDINGDDWARNTIATAPKMIQQGIWTVKSEQDVKEAEMGKIVDYKPGQTATLNTGPGMTTILDLKKNPTSLTKDPATGKLKLMGPQATGTSSATATTQPTIKAGDAVEIGKTTEDILRLAGLK